MVLRPDEEANLAEIQRDQNIRGALKSGVSTALGLATGAAGIGAVGSGISSKIMPFLNEYIPIDLAMKGISKVSPKLGNLLKKGQSMGLDLQEGLNFVKEKLSTQEEIEPAKEHRNIIEQYSPELHQFILDEVRKGRAPIEAGALAQNNKKFGGVINKITKDHKTPWSSIIQTVFGDFLGQNKQPQPNQEAASMQQQQQPNQGGPGQQELMSMLNKINQRIGK